MEKLALLILVTLKLGSRVDAFTAVNQLIPSRRCAVVSKPFQPCFMATADVESDENDEKKTGQTINDGNDTSKALEWARQQVQELSQPEKKKKYVLVVTFW